MVIDTSALLAILQREPEEERLIRAIGVAPACLISAGSLLEAGIIAQSRRGDQGARDIDLFVVRLRIEVAPVTEAQAHIARRAFRRFGKGQGHPASLNFGDCFAYALAIDTGEPLLFKGDDFSRTDVTTVPY